MNILMYLKFQISLSQNWKLSLILIHMPKGVSHVLYIKLIIELMKFRSVKMQHMGYVRT
jgi:hypothetical protein